MIPKPDPTEPPERRRDHTSAWLRAFGSAVLLVCVIAGAARTLSLFRQEQQYEYVWVSALAEFALFIAAGAACGGILVGLSVLIRILRELRSALERLERFGYERADEPTASDRAAGGTMPEYHGVEQQDAPPPPPWREILGLLEDIRDNALLTEGQRNEKRRRLADDELQNAAQRIERLSNDGDFSQTREVVEAMLRKYPDDERAHELMREVEEAREHHEAEDVAACTSQVKDLISISSWKRARELAHQLQQRHPDSAEARQLLVSIEEEFRAFEDEQKRRMGAEVQRFVSRRRWEEALVAARTFIERFPGCEESESFRMQIPTLEGNAEIEVRQRLEQRIKDLAKHGHYIEAAELARQVIEQYPDSPQAEALRKHLERLEQLALDPNAPPARVRIE